MSEPYFLKPVFHEKIWGGTKLHDDFNYDIPSDHTGECWAISAHPHGPATVENGPYAGMTLIGYGQNIVMCSVMLREMSSHY